MPVSCPHCESPCVLDFLFYRRVYYRCSQCDLIFLNREMTGEDVLNYYRERYFNNYVQEQISVFRKDTYKTTLSVIERFKSPGSLLDIGCGIGLMLKEAKDRGWEILGVDPSKQSIDYARRLVGDYFICGTLDEVSEDRQFDCVTMINVLDMMIDGNRQLAKVNSLLKRGGMIYIRIPNGFFHASLARLSSRFKCLTFINRYLIFHSYSLTPRAVKNLLARCGYEDVLVQGDRLSLSQCLENKDVPSSRMAFLLNFFFWGAKILEFVSLGRLIVCPSIRVMAWKNRGYKHEAVPNW